MLQNFTLGTFSQGASGGGAAFESIASATGTGSSDSITFTSIPGTYQHLQISGISRSTNASVGLANLTIRFNSDTTNSNYSYQGFGGDCSSPYAGGSANSQMYL